MSTFWSIWIIVIVLGTVFGCVWLLWATRKGQAYDQETDQTTGHVYDGIEELDNPMPKWWLGLFLATCVFGLIYLILYPGLGSYQGLLGWSQIGQYEDERQRADARFGEVFARYAATPIPELAQNDEAMRMGQRLFANNCSVCHGSAGRGSIGFPNLTDGVFNWGGSPEEIYQSIHAGRVGNMPARGLMPNMTATQVDQVVNYVLSLNGNRERDSAAAEAGKAVYAQACAACHGADAEGMAALGAPNLRNNTWLYGSTYEWIEETVVHGRQNRMPAQSPRLSDDQIHVLAAYVYKLSFVR